MPLYLDHHRKMFDVAPEAFQAIHDRDLAVQEKHGVRYLRFWYEPAEGHMFCLVEAPSKEALQDLHRDGSGMVPMEIYEVAELPC